MSSFEKDRILSIIIRRGQAEFDAGVLDDMSLWRSNAKRTAKDQAIIDALVEDFQRRKGRLSPEMCIKALQFGLGMNLD